MRREKTIKKTSITHLTESVLFNILCLLPHKSIKVCRCVCKDWANFISQPSFVTLYTSTSKKVNQFLFRNVDDVVLVYVDQAAFTRTGSDIRIHSTSMVNLHITRIFNIQPSLYNNIFICNITGWIVTDEYKAPYTYMYNIITGQHIVLQQSDTRGDGFFGYGYAVCFAQKSNQLKLLQFYDKSPGMKKAEIQTIGTSSWRSLEESPRLSYQGVLPVFVQGFYHWLENRVIHCFDAEEEVFRSIQTPSVQIPSNSYKYGSDIGALEGCLCISQMTSDGYACKFWVMDEYGNQDSWTMKFVVSNIESIDFGFRYAPLTCLKNGEIVIRCGTPNRLICCRPRRNIKKGKRNWKYVNLEGLICDKMWQSS